MALNRKIQNRWLISDELWSQMKPLIPPVINTHPFGGGRPQISDRQAMNGIFFVLKTGCQWRALDATGICPGSTAHARFRRWTAQGVFEAFWKAGLKKYEETKGIKWRWLALDTASCKAPVGGSKKQGKTRQIEANKG
jgi:transposase